MCRERAHDNLLHRPIRLGVSVNPCARVSVGALCRCRHGGEELRAYTLRGIACCDVDYCDERAWRNRHGKRRLGDAYHTTLQAKSERCAIICTTDLDSMRLSADHAAP